MHKSPLFSQLVLTSLLEAKAVNWYEVVSVSYLKDNYITFVTIKDPKTFQVLVRMKNPVVPIVRRSNKNKRWIDLEENVMKNEQPYFGLLFPPDFEEK